MNPSASVRDSRSGELPVYFNPKVASIPDGGFERYRVTPSLENILETVVERDGVGVRLGLRDRPTLEAIMFVSLAQRHWLEKRGIHPRISDSAWHFQPSLLMATCPPEVLLSDEAALLPVGNLTRQVSRLPPRFFIRPNSGNKQFPGQVVRRNDLEHFLATYKPGFDEIVMVAVVRPIESEIRCFVSQREKKPRIVAWSKYNHADGSHNPADVPFDQWPYADWINELLHSKELRHLFTLLPEMVVMDFAFSDGKVKLIELNSVSTSGLYSCNPEAIIAEINAIRVL